MRPQRREERKEVSFPATVKAGDRVFRDVVTNVSPSGFYLHAERQRFRTGERVRVAFSLPVAGRLVPLDVEVQVARVERDATHRVRGIGVRMLRPSPRIIEAIDAFLEHSRRFQRPAAQEALVIPPDYPDDEDTDEITDRFEPPDAKTDEEGDVGGAGG